MGVIMSGFPDRSEQHQGGMRRAALTADVLAAPASSSSGQARQSRQKATREAQTEGKGGCVVWLTTRPLSVSR
jgi:hypothetical protein